MKRALVLALLAGCSSPYEIKLADGTSVSQGTLALFGYAVPAMPPGVSFVDARPGQRVVLWSDTKFEAIVDVGDVAAVLVRERRVVRPATSDEITRLAALFPRWKLVPSPDAARYNEERAHATAATSDRLFPSDIMEVFGGLDPGAAVDLALANRPPGWMERGGRVWVLRLAADYATVPDLARIMNHAVNEPFVADRQAILKSCLHREETPASALVEYIGRVGTAAEREVGDDIVACLKHPNANQAVQIAAIESVERSAMSSLRRTVLEAIAWLPTVTVNALRRMATVEMDYDEDRYAVLRAIALSPNCRPEVGEELKKSASRIVDPQLKKAAIQLVEKALH